MLVFIKIIGITMIGAALTAWWFMVEGFVAGRIEFTTKGSVGEVWYSRVDSPNAFWIVVAVHFLFGVMFTGLGYLILRKEKLSPPLK